jgi:alkylated DNA repair protein alkB family protein 8
MIPAAGSHAVPGLRYVPDYLEPDVQANLLSAIDSLPWQDMSGQRRIQFYGHWYSPAKGGLYRVGDLPDWAGGIAVRLHRDHLMPYLADQLIVTEYRPGQGIRSHADAPIFAGVIVGITLGSTCIMELTHEGRTEQMLLEPGSAVVFSGEARDPWRHAIPARDADVWMNRTLPRGRRVSLTYRKMLAGAANLEAAT